ncbi:membrane protein insertase YidC [Candidatus Annandia pinicola]|uniref:membrane protein insertase YidC n=1 Tax=Candidatus Annandia pinicola TaxID=1345117 RepID=UPI001D00D09E|nr:membrane protein insertase YidC [Candidatus Annandia pinicola]UDG80513.1 Membrane protein insertase YidC [Candidatus Annandia pinicola]
MLKKHKFIFFFIFIFIYFFISSISFYSNFYKNHNGILILENYNNILKKNKIKIQTNVISAKININKGFIENIKLLKYKDKKTSKLLTLIKNKSDFICNFNDGLIKNNKIFKDINYYNKYYLPKFIKLKEKQNKIIISIYSKNINNLILKKSFIFYFNKYKIDLKYNILNFSKKPVKISLFNNLKQNINIENNLKKDNNYYKKNLIVAFSTSKEKYKEYDFKEIKNNIKIKEITENGWIAILQKYFLTVIIPHNYNNLIYINSIKNKIINLGYYTKPCLIYKNNYKTFETTLLLSPKIKNYINEYPYLYLTINYGLFWFISKPLFILLNFINFIVNNWGLSIIIITLLLRYIMYPVTKIQYIYMIKMGFLQPEINLIYKNFSYDKNLLRDKIINLYRREKINPLSSFLPLIIQTPVFLSLYYMITNSAELNNAPFIFWIKDLSSQDPYYVLPILMGITISIIQKMSSSYIYDYKQKKILNIIPIIFTIFFLWLPSGLVIYYIVSNIFTILQQNFIYNNIVEKRKKNII